MDTCSRCGFPVVWTAAGWAHANQGDAVACALFWTDDQDYGGPGDGGQ